MFHTWTSIASHLCSHIVTPAKAGACFVKVPASAGTTEVGAGTTEVGQERQRWGRKDGGGAGTTIVGLKKPAQGGLLTLLNR